MIVQSTAAAAQFKSTGRWFAIVSFCGEPWMRVGEHTYSTSADALQVAEWWLTEAIRQSRGSVLQLTNVTLSAEDGHLPSPPRPMPFDPGDN